MDRRDFFRGVAAAAAGVAIGPVLTPVALTPVGFNAAFAEFMATHPMRNDPEESLVWMGDGRHISQADWDRVAWV